MGRPDLTKTDALLAVMSANTVEVAKERANMEAALRSNGLDALMAVLQKKDAVMTMDTKPVVVQAETAADKSNMAEALSPEPQPTAEEANREAAAAFLAGCGFETIHEGTADIPAIPEAPAVPQDRRNNSPLVMQAMVVGVGDAPQ